MEFYYQWEWEIHSDPLRMWTLLSDTDRFNRDTGLPNIKVMEYGIAGKKKVQFKKFGITVEWVEEPFGWVWPHKFGVVRNYSKGPIKLLKTETFLSEGKVTYRTWARPANLLGWLAIPIQIGIISRYKFGQVVREYDERVKKEELIIENNRNKHDVDEKRLDGLVAEFGKVGGRLKEEILYGDDFEMGYMRPYRLADKWGIPRKNVLVSFLKMVRKGILVFEWDVICPMCRGARQRLETISEVQEEVHCQACNIDFKVNFDKYVEITFHPHPSIRKVVRGEYCVGGPGLTPHILVQKSLNPGERVEVVFGEKLEEGEYRWRGIGDVKIQKTKGKTKTQNFEIKFSNKWNSKRAICENPIWKIENDTNEEQVMIFEKLKWTEGVTTAAEVFANQEFRDLFATQALKPGKKISVGSVTVVFTDLKGSTRMYREIGDAPAFGYVLEHFEVLKKAVSDNNGAIVKTIGDAIMAVFVRPKDALVAMLEANEGMKKFDDPLLKLKTGIHVGPCIAVNLNDRLDYFGSTVNLASRLEGQAIGGGVVVTQEVLGDEAVRAWIRKESENIRVEEFKANLKGFDEEEFGLVRIERVFSKPKSKKEKKAL